jgi:hypothetical protein
MGWFFTGKPKLEENEVTAVDEAQRERELLQELPSSLANFYQSESRQSHFRFTDAPLSLSDEQRFREFSKGKGESELAAINCADYQMEFVNCITNGPWRDRVNGCDLENRRNVKCLKLQKMLFFELGLRYTKDIDKFEKIADSADKLGLNLFEKFDEAKPLGAEILSEIYDEREKVWK